MSPLASITVFAFSLDRKRRRQRKRDLHKQKIEINKNGREREKKDDEENGERCTKPAQSLYRLYIHNGQQQSIWIRYQLINGFGAKRSAHTDRPIVRSYTAFPPSHNNIKDNALYDVKARKYKKME